MNFGTLLVLLALALVVGLIIRRMIKDRKAGKLACGCDCGTCSGCGGSCCKGQ